MEKIYERRLSDDYQLGKNDIFVFLSNRKGIHNTGNALIAFQKYGASFKDREGLQGNSYALPLEPKKPYTNLFFTGRLVRCIRQRPFLNFIVPAIGFAGDKFTDKELIPCFKNTRNLDNLYLPKRYLEVLIKEYWK